MFLCAGVFIHHYGTNDMFEIGRQGGRRLKSAMVCMIVGPERCPACRRCPVFSARKSSWATCWTAGTRSGFLAGVVGAFLTTYYSFRLIFIILFPRDAEETASTSGHDGHHSVGGDQIHGRRTVVPGGVTVVLGFFQTPLDRFSWAAGAEGQGAAPPTTAGCRWPHACWPRVAIGLAWFEFGRKGARQVGLVERIPLLADLFGQRWYIDHLYRYLLDKLVYRGVSRLFTANDRRVIDGALDGLGRSTVGLGRVVARVHSGMIQYRLMIMFAAVVLLILFIGWGG